MRFKQEVAALLDNYDYDPEASHVDEDRLLERFIRLRASQGDQAATHLQKLLDTERTRWYA